MRVPKGPSLGQGWILATRGSIRGLALCPLGVAVGSEWILPPRAAQTQKERGLFLAGLGGEPRSWYSRSSRVSLPSWWDSRIAPGGAI